MVVHHNRKRTKYRGHNTHGHGASKKHRGAGSRGGRGNAGTGKRAGQKKAGLKGFRLGKEKGFIGRRNQVGKSIKSINLNEFTSKNIQKYIDLGVAVKEGAVYVLDLTKAGYGKLLGTGNTDLKLKVIVASFSAQAEEKIKAAGGEIVAE
jgi:large subunit ribosomal protein L15